MSKRAEQVDFKAIAKRRTDGNYDPVVRCRVYDARNNLIHEERTVVGEPQDNDVDAIVIAAKHLRPSTKGKPASPEEKLLAAIYGETEDYH